MKKKNNKIINKILKILSKILGIILIIGGFAGLFLPFFQGIAMILAGAFLLGGKPLLKKIKIKLYDFRRKIKNLISKK